MNRLLLAAALFLCGIYSFYVSHSFLILIIIAIAIYVIYLSLKGRYAMAVCSVFIAAAGFLLIILQYGIITKNAAAYYDTKAFVMAKVENSYTDNEYSYADLLLYEKDNEVIKEKVRARVYGDNLTLERGDIITASIRFYEPSRGNNFGDTNTKLLRVSKKIGLSGRFSDDSIKVIEKELSYFSPKDLGYIIKSSVLQRTKKYFGGADKGIARALLTGDKAEVPKVIDDAFKKSGMSHMIAVSGMHINIIIALITGIFFITGMKRSKVALVISMLLMWLFVFVTGCAPSSLRAGIMTSLLLLSFFINKASDNLSSLGAATLLILVVSPAAAFDPGFMLSVAATFSILIFSSPIKNKLSFLPGALADILSITIAGQIATMPVLTCIFGTIPVYGIISNLIICPLLTFIMIVSVFAVILGGLPIVGTVLIWIVDIFANGMASVALIVSRVPGASLALGQPGVLRLLGYALFCVALYYLLTDKKIKSGAFCAASVFIYSIVFVCFVFSQTAKFTFVNVRHGDCMIFRNSKITVMFDSGGSETLDVAKDILIPYLDRQGIKKIDVAFITHYHSDHCKSYIKLLEEGRINRIVLPENICDADIRKEILNAAKESNTDFCHIKGGEKLCFGGLEVSTFNTYRDDNINNGIIYAVKYGECSALISGDADMDGEKRAIPFAVANKSDILKVSHHGSQTSSDSTFVKAVGASVAVISASNYDKVSEKTIDVLKENVSKIYETDSNGTIEFIFDRDKFKSINLMKK